MRYSEISGHRVSAVTLGTAQLGMNYGIANREGKPDRLKSFAILAAALKKGINSFDTARSYGDSEKILGDFFSAVPGHDKDLFITTKLSSGLGPGSAAAEVEAALVKSMEASLSALKLPGADCILMHNANDLRIHGRIVTDTLRNIIARGWADMAGISVYNPEETELLLEDDIFRVIQLPMNVLDQRFLVSGALDRLRKRGIHVFVRSIFFQGLLLMDSETITDPDLKRYAVPRLRVLKRLSDKAGMSAAQFALTFIRDIPGIDSLVLGMENPQQAAENLALYEAPPLDDSLRHEAEESFKDLEYPEIMAVLSRPRQ